MHMSSNMIFRKQIILVAVTICVVLSCLQNINNPDKGRQENAGEANRLTAQKENLQQMTAAVRELKRLVDILTSHLGQDIALNPKALLERRKMEELAKVFSDAEKENVEEEEEEDVEQLSEEVDSSNHTDIIDGRLMSSTGKPVRVVVLVGSTARSGTSFLGELLSQFDNVLYLFEPELHVRVVTKEMVTEETGIPLLKDMIYCHISRNFSTWLRTRASSFNIFRHPITKTHCKNWSTCLAPSRLRNACRGEHIRVMKVIRIRMAWMRPLLDDPQVDLKVIHLVRDPRGSLFSMAKHQLHKLDPGLYCPLIEDDMIQTPRLMLEYPGRVLGITYEQLCLDPMGKATEIWRFLIGDDSAKLSPRWALYMENHVSRPSANQLVDVYGTVRNTNEQYQAWRASITEHVLLDIEASCESVLRKLGYNLFGSLERARNTSYSLFMNQDKPV
ncbi:carbohydrate sulfotransferase 3-like [Macrobrachium rosenbergii]|uniref:carbohydrate sulfotransferase 3-like n=1 Tax=Macrobrachium rosenbergii TaxID=79674 RepID=UPI0034D5C11D